MTLNHLNYPLDFTFKLTTLSSDFNITDVNGNHVAYVRQKMFKLKEDVVIYNNDKKEKELFRIKADRWLDFNASYTLEDVVNHKRFGRLARHGVRSLWKAHYEIVNEKDEVKFTVSEDNALVKYLDDMVGNIPVLGMFTGYILNPTYSVKDASGKAYFQLKKMPSFFGRKFKLERLIDIDDEEETLVILSLLMMVLLEKNRG
ncbi:hypothetical protein [Riemerella columbina]|uniref:hypothetical protein n=1 Tax=Riemerella columbina TaxID=103810 RepID=UPI000369CF5C|nr:hypothetical protein [Riemerella columbina]